jgi:hypothetical protein
MAITTHAPPGDSFEKIANVHRLSYNTNAVSLLHILALRAKFMATHAPRMHQDIRAVVAFALLSISWSRCRSLVIHTQ